MIYLVTVVLVVLWWWRGALDLAQVSAILMALGLYAKFVMVQGQRRKRRQERVDRWVDSKDPDWYDETGRTEPVVEVKPRAHVRHVE